MKILITGTPGSGKSTLLGAVATELEKRHGRPTLTVAVNDFIRENSLYDKYDAQLDTYIIDDRKVRRSLKSHLRSLDGEMDAATVVLFETHTVSCLPKEAIDHCFVLTARTDVIYDRLLARGYSTEKIAENVECEIMMVVQEEAVDHFGAPKVTILRSNAEEDIEDNVDRVLEFVGSKTSE